MLGCHLKLATTVTNVTFFYQREWFGVKLLTRFKWQRCVVTFNHFSSPLANPVLLLYMLGAHFHHLPLQR